jgi:hypothetical protein
MSRSIRVIGWSTAIFSIIIILSEFSNLLTNPMEQFNIVFQMFPQAKGSMDAMTEIFQYSRIWSAYSVLYFCFVLLGSIQFLQFKTAGRLNLEIACWIGMFNACADTFLSYTLWKQMQAALSRVEGTLGMGLGNLNPFGVAAILLGFFLWIIPTIGLVVYLRKPALKSLFK